MKRDDGRVDLARLAVFVLLTAVPAAAQELTTYAEVDTALEETLLVPEGALWKLHVGRSEPSPALEWARSDFDDSSWDEAPSGFAISAEAGTRLPEMLDEGLTTIHLRYELDVDPDRYERIKLELPLAGGYVFRLNGTEEGRLHSGKSRTRQAIDAQATQPRGVDVRPLPTIDLRRKLRPGKNVFALQVLDPKDAPGTMHIVPVVRATYPVVPDEERARLAEIAPRVGGEHADALAAYLQGRHYLRLGDPDTAAPFLVKATELDPAAPEPWARLVECARMADREAELEGELRARVEAGSTTPALLDAWARVLLEDLGGAPDELLAGVPEGVELPATGLLADAHFAFSELGAGRPLRVDCGARADEGGWSRDRFFTDGGSYALDRSEAGLEGIERAVRVCDRSLDVLAPPYRVPVPDGAYEIRVQPRPEGEPDPSVVDVHVDEGLALVGHPLVASGAEGELRFPILVRDGFLELDLLPRRLYVPEIFAFEVHPLDPARFLELAEGWAAESEGRVSLALVQLAEARMLAGEGHAALEAFEKAERLNDFRPVDRARLAELRDGFLPDVPTLATAEDLLERRRDEVPALLAAFRAAGGDEGAAARAAYLEGRLYQLEGRIDEALALFEELAFSEAPAPPAVLRFVECLRDAGLPEDAEGLLREQLDAGLPLTDELLTLWLALQRDDLLREPWPIVRELRERGDVPAVLHLLPTSEGAPRPWEFTTDEPPTTTWSRPTYDARTWERGAGGIGSGSVVDAVIRSPWNTQTIFARQAFELPSSRQLFAHVLLHADDAGDVYLNGTREDRVSGPTGGYILLPQRDGFARGANVLGFYGYNATGPSFMDLGVVVPFGELFRVLDDLEEVGALRIDCGGEGFETPDGTVWSEDRFFCQGAALVSDTPPEIAGTELDALYVNQTHWPTTEYETARYQVPLPAGRYRVTLHFAEIEEEFASPGARVYDVLLEKEKVLVGLDVCAEVGPEAALVRSFEVEVLDDWLDVDFLAEHYLTQPSLAGLEIERLE